MVVVPLVVVPLVVVPLVVVPLVVVPLVGSATGGAHLLLVVEVLVLHLSGWWRCWCFTSLRVVEVLPLRRRWVLPPYQVEVPSSPWCGGWPPRCFPPGGLVRRPSCSSAAWSLLLVFCFSSFLSLLFCLFAFVLSSASLHV